MSENTYRSRRLRSSRRSRLDEDWGGPTSVESLLSQARRDSDPVSLNVIGETYDDCTGAVVVLKGNQVVRMFREWALRNRVLTEGKAISE